MLDFKKLLPLEIKKAIKYRFDDAYKSQRDKERDYEVEYNRIRKMTPGVAFSTSLMGTTVRAVDAGSFLYMYREIFQDRIYEFKTVSSKPYIIDGGANIGLASIFFAINYADATIISFEADPAIASVCQDNIDSFRLKNVSLITKALWDEETTLNFFSEGRDAGRIVTDNSSIMQVKTDTLGKYLDREVDFLKLDIEGAECRVINEISDKLHLVRNLFVEYHSFVSASQQLGELLNTLKEAGFRYVLTTPSIKNKTPLKTKSNFLGMDFYINIFGTRD